MTKKNKMIIYQAKSGAIAMKGDYKKETLWASQAQMAILFDVNPQAITKHLKNIYDEGELLQKATCSKMEQVQIEGGRTIKRYIQIYNLDAIISVGYRINSKTGTNFRQWATKILRTHIVRGYTINASRIKKNYDAFLEAVEEVKKLIPAQGALGTNETIELVKTFANTWFSLDAYDKSAFPVRGVTKKHVDITADELKKAVAEFKNELMKKRETTELFGQERGSGSFTGIVGNIFQSFDKRDLYPSVEEKAAHLLYFVIKNHPFTDGNKRSGAFSFVWFLRKARVLNTQTLTPEALTVLTLLIAESDPKEKDRMVGLVLLLLRKNYKAR
jgi:prophage maintenance system killer protein